MRGAAEAVVGAKARAVQYVEIKNLFFVYSNFSFISLFCKLSHLPPGKPAPRSRRSSRPTLNWPGNRSPNYLIYFIAIFLQCLDCFLDRNAGEAVGKIFDAKVDAVRYLKTL